MKSENATANANDAVSAQARLIEALGDPACYPHPSAGVEHIETHISHVLLAGAFAYKLKKPLDLGFLDFSTLAQRRFYCDEELRLNRRLAPQLYLDVVPIRGSIAAPQLGGTTDAAGEIIDYAVKMQRFPQEALFDRLARNGALTAEHIDALAEVVAHFHAAAARSDAAAPWGNDAAIATPMRQNFTQLRELPHESTHTAAQTAALDRIEAWSLATHVRLAERFAQRRSDGWVRECHGDLHLGNVAWLDGAALPFDGIEFNANLRWIDVISEVAFMVMDLHAHDLAALAWRFLNGWLEHSGDYAGIALLDYYLVYRAMVRAKIARLRAAQGDIAATERQQALADHAHYIALAERFCAPHPPALLVMHGLSGSGKSVLAGAVCTRLGAIRVRSDVERKRLHGLAPLARSASTGGDIYDATTTHATYAELARLAGVILGSGRTAVIDAAFLKRSERDQLRAVAQALGVPLLCLTCQADAATLQQRVAARAQAGNDASEADGRILRMQQQWQEPLDEPAIPAETRLTLDTGRLSTAEAVDRVVTALAACARQRPASLDARPATGC